MLFDRLQFAPQLIDLLPGFDRPLLGLGELQLHMMLLVRHSLHLVFKMLDEAPHLGVLGVRLLPTSFQMLTSLALCLSHRAISLLVSRVIAMRVFMFMRRVAFDPWAIERWRPAPQFFQVPLEMLNLFSKLVKLTLLPLQCSCDARVRPVVVARHVPLSSIRTVLRVCPLPFPLALGANFIQSFMRLLAAPLCFGAGSLNLFPCFPNAALYFFSVLFGFLMVLFRALASLAQSLFRLLELVLRLFVGFTHCLGRLTVSLKQQVVRITTRIVRRGTTLVIFALVQRQRSSQVRFHTAKHGVSRYLPHTQYLLSLVFG